MHVSYLKIKLGKRAQSCTVTVVVSSVWVGRVNCSVFRNFFELIVEYISDYKIYMYKFMNYIKNKDLYN